MMALKSLDPPRRAYVTSRLSAPGSAAGHAPCTGRFMPMMKRLVTALVLVTPTLTARANQAVFIEFEPRTRSFAASVSGTGALVAGTIDGGGGF